MQQIKSLWVAGDLEFTDQSSCQVKMPLVKNNTGVEKICTGTVPNFKVQVGTLSDTTVSLTTQPYQIMIPTLAPNLEANNLTYVDLDNLSKPTENMVNSACSEANFDFVIGIDARPSISQENFIKAINFAEKIVNTINFENLATSSNPPTVTLYQFDHDVAGGDFSCGGYYCSIRPSTRMESKSVIDTTFSSLKLETNRHRNSRGLSGMYTMAAYASQLSRNPSKGHINLFISGGPEIDAPFVESYFYNVVHQNFQDDKVLNMMIGIGDDLSDDHLKLIGSDPDSVSVYALPNFDLLEEIRSKVNYDICQFAETKGYEENQAGGRALIGSSKAEEQDEWLTEVETSFWENFESEWTKNFTS